MDKHSHTIFNSPMQPTLMCTLVQRDGHGRFVACWRAIGPELYKQIEHDISNHNQRFCVKVDGVDLQKEEREMLELLIHPMFFLPCYLTPFFHLFFFFLSNLQKQCWRWCENGIAKFESQTIFRIENITVKVDAARNVLTLFCILWIKYPTDHLLLGSGVESGGRCEWERKKKKRIFLKKKNNSISPSKSCSCRAKTARRQRKDQTHHDYWISHPGTLFGAEEQTPLQKEWG